MTDLSSFEPKDKYAILINGKSFNKGFALNKPDFPRWNPFVSGNLNIYDWELLMTGTVDFGERSPLNCLDAVNPSYIVRANLEDTIQLYEKGDEPNGGFKEAIKIWPGTKHVFAEFKEAVKRIASLSSQDTLTTMIMFSHGDYGSIKFGDLVVPYTLVLAELDKIKGKKVLFIYGCYSGSIIRNIIAHKERENYAVIASSEANKKSTNWDDRALDDELFKHFRKGGKLSDLELKPVEQAMHSQCPQMVNYFDVQLI